MPKLTVPMAAIIQGFPPEWRIWGRKTHAYKQVGNAFPPPVARAVASQIYRVLVRNEGMLRHQAVHDAMQVSASEVEAGVA